MTEYRKGLPERPLRMRKLPLNSKGYPVPFFVDYINGEPEFRAMDPVKWKNCIKFQLCWLCGEPLGKYITFVAGPMCGVNRTSGEPPSHHDCADYAARACPFLTLPKAVRREAGLPEHLRERAASPTLEGTGVVGGTSITRNPGVTMLWTTKMYWVRRDGQGGFLITMGDPDKVEWYAEGRPATREEVEESVRTGLPYLESIAESDEDLRELRSMIEQFEPLLPKGT